MSAPDPFVSKLESYLDEYEGSTPLPEAVRDAIRAELPLTPQRPAWWPTRRRPEMNTFVKFGLAAAVVTVAVALGFYYFVAPNIGSPGLDDPPPTPSPTPADIGAFPVGEPLEGGRYRIGEPFVQPLTLAVPDGWAFDRLTEGEAQSSGSDQPFLGFYPVTGVYIDPCHPEDGRRPGPVSVESVESGLLSQTGFDAGPVSGAVVAGLPARHFTISNDIDTDAAGCTNGALIPIFDAAGDVPVSTNGGTAQLIWLVDVGGDVVLIAAETRPETEAADLAAIEDVLESASFE